MLDRDRYPLLADYLDRLPDGLASYPDCQSKATLLQSSLDAVTLDEAVGLPDELTALLRDPPAAGLWVPAVWSDAMFFVACDLYYPTEAQVLAWTRERTESIAKHPLYRTLLRVPGPRVLLRMGASAHDLVQRGTELHLEADAEGAWIEMRFPPHLHVGLNLVSNVALWQSVVEITGGRNVACTMTRATATLARYRVTFE